MSPKTIILCAACALGASVSFAEEPVTLSNAPEPPAADAREPLAPALSLERAARYLDGASLHWQRTRKCGTCHTNFAYLVARPSLATVAEPSREVRAFFESMVEVEWKERGPRWDAEVICAATTLAFNDALTTGSLHASTRKALDRIWTLQKEDGGFDWLKCGDQGWPPMEYDDHYGVTFAALGVGIAPGRYAETDDAKKGLEGIRKYLKANPAPTLHHRLMVLWASQIVEGLLEPAEQKAILEEAWKLERPGGGWATAGLLVGLPGFKRSDGTPQDLESSDGYATGFVVYVARQAGVPAADPHIARGVEWLKTHQRESGRWFTRSPTRDSKHYISNVGTGFAVMALEACGEVKKGAAWKPLFDGKTLAGWKKTEFGGSLDARVEDGKLILPLGEPMTGVTWTKDFPRTGYEIDLEAQRVDGQDFFCGLTFPAGEGHASLILGGWGGGVSGISSINGRDASENETMFYREFEKGKWYAVRLRVTREAIEVWLDGDPAVDDPIVDLETTGKKIDVRADIRLATPLGLSTWRTAAALRNIRWRPVEE